MGYSTVNSSGYSTVNSSGLVSRAYHSLSVEGIQSLNLFVGNCKQMQQVYQEIKQVADTQYSVSIYGETGTGKEVVAKAIHQLSERRGQPLISINCGTIPKDLAESELFGHEKGAFSGAMQTKLGKFELANGGTLFLDEIGELPLETQTKLLRVLQEKEIWRVGGQRSIPVNVRLLVATHRDLEQEVQKNNFRADLFYRFNVFPIFLPPLRDREHDIALLAHHFLKENAPHIPGFQFEAIQTLEKQYWPGNVRELQHCIERGILYYSGNGPLTKIALFGQKNKRKKTNTENAEKAISLDDKIKEIVKEALSKNGNNKSQTAKELQITRPRLDRLIQKYKF